MQRLVVSCAAPVAAGIAALVMSGQVAASYGFQGLGFLPDGYNSYAYSVNADGSVIGGQSEYTTGIVGFVWENGVMSPRETVSGQFGTVTGVSGDGSTAVGYSSNQGVAWRDFTNTDTLVQLGYINSTGQKFSRANAVNGDGSLAAGYSTVNTVDSVVIQATIFGNVNGGVITRTNLGALTPDVRSEAFGISADGAVVVGESNNIGGQQAFRWNSSEQMVGLGDLPGGGVDSSAKAASSDGTVIVGYGTAASGRQAFRWVQDGGANGGGTMTSLGSLADAVALGVSGDGSVVVGQYAGGFDTAAFLWTEDLGMVDLQAFLVSQGVTGLESWMLQSATAISADGTTIVGYGYDAFFQVEAFRVDISSLVPGPSAAGLIVMAGMVASRRRRV